MRVLVTGIGGQDGFYLAQQMLHQGHDVTGILRTRAVPLALSELQTHSSQLQLLTGDVTDRDFLRSAIVASAPDQIYNLAAQSHVGESFTSPVPTFEVNTLAPLYLLELIRQIDPHIRFFQACSAEVFGENPPAPQTETTPFAPASPYAVSKASAFWLVESYRRSYGLFACSAILYNHESPLRDESFLSGKVVHAIARILQGRQQTLALGNLDVQRDWGFAGDYVEAMALMLEQEQPTDYVIASGQTYSVGEFVEAAFGYVGLDWRQYVVVDAKLLRPADAQLLRGDAGRARRQLGWQPRLDFQMLVELMVDAAIKQSKQTALSAALGES
ncbi:GDP-mannose 4,6-dehydratase [Gloeobacter kilaueensis]|uniref:GDP-mannose 4,6-dehydratase n=1 Tax=Gloeobacter kilaueensis (strain ATCC BAA-2537 / CCAP 1431/1 / ULC 316 / JS1) TaxID=1183438 RepID=U5QGX0_GLOK1|nr:GDP-mannose 4,6-dehydratase [Gloeobacter kilaueensis]AGY58191.1 GDP-mannose 4,6-dehydratase [Gloeobacter kilaueensis JS1]